VLTLKAPSILSAPHSHRTTHKIPAHMHPHTTRRHTCTYTHTHTPTHTRHSVSVSVPLARAHARARARTHTHTMRVGTTGDHRQVSSGRHSGDKEVSSLHSASGTTGMFGVVSCSQAIAYPVRQSGERGEERERREGEGGKRDFGSTVDRELFHEHSRHTLANR
jgi:hypothetical protein